MKKLIALLTIAPIIAQANVLINDDGATCNIPQGFNAASYDSVWNPRGMSDFCVFPDKQKVDDFWAYLKNCKQQNTLDYPVCKEGLTISPGPQGPCYKLIHR